MSHNYFHGLPRRVSRTNVDGVSPTRNAGRGRSLNRIPKCSQDIVSSHAGLNVGVISCRAGLYVLNSEGIPRNIFIHIFSKYHIVNAIRYTVRYPRQTGEKIKQICRAQNKKVCKLT